MKSRPKRVRSLLVSIRREQHLILLVREAVSCKSRSFLWGQFWLCEIPNGRRLRFAKWRKGGVSVSSGKPSEKGHHDWYWCIPITFSENELVWQCERFNSISRNRIAACIDRHLDDGKIRNQIFKSKRHAARSVIPHKRGQQPCREWLFEITKIQSYDDTGLVNRLYDHAAEANKPLIQSEWNSVQYHCKQKVDLIDRNMICTL